MQHWLYLSVAIVMEVAGTTSMKLSQGFANPIASTAIFACYGISFWALTHALTRIEVGIAYAIWAGVGTALIAVIGIVFFREGVSLLKLVSLGAIVLGVVGLNLAQGSLVR